MPANRRSHRRASFHPYTTLNRILTDINRDNRHRPSRTVIITEPVHIYNTRHPRMQTVIVTKPSRAAPPPPFKSFHTLFPGMSAAFSDGEYDPTTVAPPHYSYPLSSLTPMPELFTHIIRIVHPSVRLSKVGCKYSYSEATAQDRSELTSGESWINYDEASMKIVLTLVVSAEPVVPENVPSLTLDQAIITRDFISLALPYSPYCQYKPRSTSLPPTPYPPHVLITGPEDFTQETALDISFISASYYAFVTTSSIPAALRRFKNTV
ncbi:hypothetical protein CPB84DRAFT_1785048 [Gymnopilus junonius]|uniref:Uncharacterized protein n=1 Tax=Gymnopilus junonius TaxID=109634 RepID=A0A9P5NJG4_GYMJU|nr:hypothetical protein CPB84DRAFT_1785048 [Gymnopilus junonius]